MVKTTPITARNTPTSNTRGVPTAIAIGAMAIAVGTPLVFDVGVFLAVIGVVLTIVFTLAETVLPED